MRDGSTKSRVLDVLTENMNSAVSGEDLAGLAGVSRSAVWKAVSSLKQQGYNIEARRNLGYILKPSNVISRSGIVRHLKEPKLGELIVIMDAVDSTNNEAKRYAAASARGGAVDRIFIANEQTAGRGRRGRSFYSPPGTGVYMSFLIHPDMAAAEAVRLTTAASVAVCRSLEEVFGVQPRIKWVNDVYLNDKKLCGILTEAISDFETGIVHSAIVGIGVNLSTDSFPDDISGVAGAVCPGGDGSERSRFIAALINSFTGMFSTENGAMTLCSYIDEYKKRSMVIGRRIRILNTGELAEALDVDSDGSLIVRTDGGGVERLSGGEISIRLSE